jgi:ABC-type lipoprotein export system ATPase subunit
VRQDVYLKTNNSLRWPDPATYGGPTLPRDLPRALSGGQQQRVAVARALAGNPSILLADEPTGNLDSKNGEAVMDLLKELHNQGATICMVTHDPRYADFADRKIQLFDGCITEESVKTGEAVPTA